MSGTVERRATGRGPAAYVLWGLLGAVSVVSLWNAASAVGAVAMFACIGAAFVLWHVLGSRGSWVALIVLGVGMCGLTGWQAATGERCPAPGTKVFLKENKPPVGCTDVRTGAGAMSVFFGMVALIGIAAPIYARRIEDDPTDELGTGDDLAGA